MTKCVSRSFIILVAGLFSAVTSSPLRADTFFNPIISDGADPWTIYQDGFYYYTQTTGNDVKVRRAARLTGSAGLGNAEEVTVFTPAAPFNKNVWAPELHFLNGKWYIYFAADDGNNANHRMYVAEAVLPHPQGPYVSKGKIYDATTDRWAIDGTVLQKDDGSLYFIWSGWPGSVDGKQNLYIAPMSDPWTISGPRVLLATPSYSWEGWIEEGPEVIKRNGKLFIVYSANASWMDDYCLGLLSNTDGDVLNPASWAKHPSPVFQRYEDVNGGVYGPGHASFTKSVDQTEDWIVYHAAKFSGAGWNRNVRTQKFTWNVDDSPNLGNPIPTSAPLTVPSGEGTPEIPAGNYTLTVTTNGHGTVAKNPDQSSYEPNSTVTLTALPNVGNRFIGWSGDAGGTNNPLTIMMDSHKSITGNFSDEMIIDNPEAAFTGSWITANSAPDKYGSSYRYATTVTTAPTATATFTPDIPTLGKYDVYVWYPQGINRPTDAPYDISSVDGNITVLVNQTANGGGWRLIAGEKNFAQGTNGFVRVSNNSADAGKAVMADAVRFVYATNQDRPPSIMAQPQNQNATVGSNVTFTITAAGSMPLSYRWRFNGISISGATTSSYTRNNVQSSDAGNYSVTITNAFGSVTSADAVLNVYLPPSIVRQPQSQAANLGGTITFSVEAIGTGPLGYQWRFNDDDIADATSASYSKTNVTPADAGNYSVVVRNSIGSVTSSNATLTVSLVPQSFPPTITSQPEDQAVNQGANATFSVEASGTAPFFYQWQFNEVDIEDATESSYTRFNAQPSHAGHYSVLVSNVFGSAMSSNAMLTVNVPPSIAVQPQNQEVKLGSNVTFSVTATGTPPLSYQWQFNGTNVSGATENDYTRTAVQTGDAGNYSVVVTNVAGTGSSDAAVLTVLPLQPVQFESIHLLSDGRVRLNLSGEPGRSYAIDGSSNLVEWATLTNLANPTGAFEFIDQPATGHVPHFYRAILTP